MDKLDEMFDTQYNLQTYLGTWGKIKTPSDKQNFINQMILACQEEIVEVMRETGYKNPEYVKFGWKKNQLPNLMKMQDELVDLFHFFMNLCFMCGMDGNKLYKKYMAKNKENIERQKNGY